MNIAPPATVARRVALLAIVVLAVLAGCGQQNPAPVTGPRYADRPGRDVPPEFRFAIHPLHNPAKLYAVYQPLVDDLNRHLGARAQIVLEASIDYADFENKYRRGEPAFLLPNPWQTLEAEKIGYHVVGVAGEDSDFKGIFIVRKDAGIARLDDLRGRVVSYPAATALAACIMPQYFLHRHGIDVRHDITNHYVGSQESSIMNVYLRESAAGATWPPPWRQFQRDHPSEAAQLKVAWETEPLVNNSVMARDDIPAEVVEQVVARLVVFDGTALPSSGEPFRFRRASAATYAPVRDYVAAFERDVRPVRQP